MVKQYRELEIRHHVVIQWLTLPLRYLQTVLQYRLGDATGGHGSWVPNSISSTSSNVFADEIGAVNAPTLEETIPITPQQFFLPKFKETTVSYASNIQQVGLSQVPPDHPYKLQNRWMRLMKFLIQLFVEKDSS